MTVAKIEVPAVQIGELCRRHGIRRLGLFGSVLTGRFSDASDIDVLVEFRPEERAGFLRLADIACEKGPDSSDPFLKSWSRSRRFGAGERTVDI
jgi:predicted nucleotidyltransferase